jgi:hypothetical protein
MPSFEPIQITTIIVKDVTKPRNDGTRGSALYNVPFQLSRRPPAAWAEYFPKAWDHPTSFTSQHRPGICEVVGDRIWLNGTTLEEVEATHQATLKLALAETNTKYAAHETEQLAAKEKQRQTAEDHERHVTETAKKIKFD